MKAKYPKTRREEMKEHILYSTVAVLVLSLFIFGVPFLLPLVGKGVNLSFCAGAKLAGIAPFKHVDCGREKGR